jgi:starch phosphorylase
MWADEVHMADLAVVGSHSVNGVAAVHSQILKDSVLHVFVSMFTGTVLIIKLTVISHRRWLIVSNPELSALIDEAIGTEWRLHPDKLIELEKFADDKAFKNKLWNVKQKRKAILAAYIKKDVADRYA